MKQYKVFLRRLISTTTLRLNIRRYLKQINLSQFVCIQTKFMLNGNKEPTQSLGRKFILDLNNNDDREFYFSYLIEQYNTKYVNNHNPSKITGICFNCTISNKEEYTNFINKINQDNSI